MTQGIFFKNLRYFLLLPLILTLASCSESDGDSTNFIPSTELTLNAAINDTIPSYGTKVYRFKTIDAGNYTISLTNQATDLGWALLSYDPADTYLNQLADNIVDIINGDIYLDTTDEVYTIALQSDKYYYVIVDEYDDIGSSSYTLQILY